MRKTHGFNNTNLRLHVTWSNMKNRCFNKDNKRYSIYGGAGITVCLEWLEFIPFMEWSLLNGYSDSLTIDRVDNTKSYSPENCRYVDVSTQNANKRITNKNKSGYIGVSIALDKFSASIQWRGVKVHLGTFVNSIDAAISRDKYVKENNLPHTLNFN